MDLIEAAKQPGQRHPWELSRARCFLGLIRDRHRGTRYGDIGAGDLFFARQLRGFSDRGVHAVDSGFADRPAKDGLVLHKSPESLPKNSFDVIFLMDVLEHVEEDGVFLQQVLEALKIGGTVLITVPAHPFLFSRHDVFLHHFRRYTYRSLLETVHQRGLEIVSGYYFYTTLFFPGLLQKFLAGVFASAYQRETTSWPFGAGHILTRTFTAVLKLDFTINRFLAGFGIRLTGLSLWLICREKSA